MNVFSVINKERRISFVTCDTASVRCNNHYRQARLVIRSTSSKGNECRSNVNYMHVRMRGPV